MFFNFLAGVNQHFAFKSDFVLISQLNKRSFKMKILNYRVLTFLIVAHLSSVCYAQTPEKQLKDSANGYSFLLPAGFESQQNEEGFVLTNSAKTVALVVKNHNFQSFQKFAEQANLEKDGFSLIGKVQDLDQQGKTFRASKLTAQGTLITDTFVLFSPFGGGVLVVAFSDAQNADKSFQKALTVSKTVGFSKPVASAAGNQLQNLFRGKHLLYLYTASGFSERIDIYLCPSGSFIYRTNSSSLSANGSGALGGNSDGNWKISASGNNASLILQFNNGATRQYSISARQASNEISLNGNRYFVQNHNQCR